MKANELRVGNLINEFGIPRRVLPNDILGLYQIEQAGKICIDLTPIPLTKEILLKAGFIKEYGGPQKGTFTIDSLEGTYFEYGNDFIGHPNENICGDYDGCIHIRMPEYFHQLQNIYFVLKGEELMFKENA